MEVDSNYSVIQMSLNAQKFNNLTGSNVFAVNASSADSVQWSVGLPKLSMKIILFIFGGLKSNNYAAYGSAITTDANVNYLQDIQMSN